VDARLADLGEEVEVERRFAVERNAVDVRLLPELGELPQVLLVALELPELAEEEVGLEALLDQQPRLGLRDSASRSVPRQDDRRGPVHGAWRARVEIARGTPDSAARC
jgi:hypothetical protein